MKVILNSIGSQYNARAIIFLPLSSAILFNKAVWSLSWSLSGSLEKMALFPFVLYNLPVSFADFLVLLKVSGDISHAYPPSELSNRLLKVVFELLPFPV